MKLLKTFSRIIVAFVFIFSGFVKLVDPIGSTYKFTDYFNAFGIEFMVPLALPLAIIMSSFEMILGISLLYGYVMRYTAWALLLMMSFFTILTLIIALTDPVSDCGCFGDAVVMSNWQTFLKNIVLILLTLVIFFYRNQYKQIRGPVTEWLVIAFFFLVMIFFSLYNYNHLPLLDFRPFSKGADIVAGMEIPKGAPEDVYETTLFYRNIATGEEKEFSIENIPESDVWEFIDSESRIISKGYEPPIHDFNIIGSNGEDITDMILKYPGYTFLLVSYNLNLADKQGLEQAADYYKIARVLDDVRFCALTASVTDDVSEIRDSLMLAYDFCSVDETLLKTIIRSNPGLLLLKNGIVIGKWHYNDFPQLAKIDSELRDLIDLYPLSPGVALESLQTPEAGSGNDINKNILAFQNAGDDHSAIFPGNIALPDNDWKSFGKELLLKKIVTELPLFDFKVIQPDGIDISEQIIRSSFNTFLVIAGEPDKITPALMEKINHLTTSTGNKPAVFYGLSDMKPDQLSAFTDTFISPVIYCSAPSSFIERIAGDGISLVWLQNGKVAGIWKDDNIPLPENFEHILSEPAEILVFETKMLPYILKMDRLIYEKLLIYVFVIGFFFFSLLLRLFHKDPFLKNK